MFTDLLWGIATSLPVMAVLAAVAVAGIGGSMLGLVPFPWSLFARPAGLAALGALCFIAGFRVSDERQAMASLKNELAVTRADLDAEKRARTVDAEAIKALAVEKEQAERKNDELQDQVNRLPLADRCIATPERIKQLHGGR